MIAGTIARAYDAYAEAKIVFLEEGAAERFAAALNAAVRFRFGSTVRGVGMCAGLDTAANEMLVHGLPPAVCVGDTVYFDETESP